jgi:DNA-binding CsgD family transcriptional regulator
MNKRGRPPNYSETQFTEVWRLWNEGNKLWDIAQILQINPGSIHIILHKHGGIAPYERKQREGQLTIEEREAISRGLAADTSLRDIAHSLGRTVSTISREVSRNGGKNAYRAMSAHDRAQEQRRRPKEPLINHVFNFFMLEKWQFSVKPVQSSSF